MPRKVGYKTLERWKREWQSILRLDDWVITIKFVRKDDMPEEDVQGHVKWNYHAKTAWIRVLDPRDYTGDGVQDIEDTVVHELVHLHLAPWETGEGTAEYALQEQAIELITGALLAVKRRKGKRK